MKIIAIEEHFLTKEVRAAWKAAPADEQQEELHLGVIEDRLDEMAAGRIALMDETGIDVQVLSLTTPALHNLGPESVALARDTNDMLAAVVQGNPGRFQGFATLPVADPGRAVVELERCIKQLGMKGVMLCGRTKEKNLDHRDFWPMLAAAAELGVPVFIHPQAPQKAVREVYYSGFDPMTNLAFSTFGLGWHYEAGIQFVRLVLAGVFDQYPTLQIILGHWGEVILFYLERLASLNRFAKLERPFADYVRQNLYVTASGMYSNTYLQRTVEAVGVDRILFSSDYPYQYRPGWEARRFMENTPLDDRGKEKFGHLNWERLTGNQ